MTWFNLTDIKEIALDVSRIAIDKFVHTSRIAISCSIF